MKNLIMGALTALFLISCSEESNLPVTEDSFDASKVAALRTASPDATLDGTSEGLYRGIFVSADTKYHGELVVSVDGVQDPMALVILDNGKELYFKGQDLGENQYQFRGRYASFGLNVSDINNVEVTNSDLNNRPIHIRLVKDDASKGAVVSLGTFVDDLDPGFGGTWDLVSNSTFDLSIPIPIPPFVFTQTVNRIDEVIICYDDGTPEGKMFNDTEQESFATTGCGLAPAGTYDPFTLGPGIITLPIIGPRAVEEYAAFAQSSDILGDPVIWDLGATLNGTVPGVRTYVDLTCVETTSGVWSWRGRSGTILLN